MKKKTCACKHHICGYCRKVVEAKEDTDEQDKKDAAKSWWEKLKEFGVPKDSTIFSGQSSPAYAWF